MNSFKASIDEHRPFVRASLRHLRVPASGIDDAVQDVFLVLVRRRDDFDPRRGLSERGWIWGICRNSLDAGSRALWLARCEGRSATELARALDLPLTTVQWRLRRAKHQVVTLLRDAARHGNAILGWFLRPQRGLASLAAPLLIVSTLADPAPDRTDPRPAATKPHRVVPSTLRRRVRHPPPPTMKVESTPAIEGRVVEEAPTVRRPKPSKRQPAARVSLGEPSLQP